jgi:heme-degrading monooxygenase HmoA
MPHPALATVADPVFRIDRFKVPATAAAPFLARVHRIRELLAPQPGCRQNLVLTETGGDGVLRVITLVEWASPEAMAAARVSVQRRYAGEGFDPQAFMHQLGVEADFGVYAPAAASA